MRNFLLGLIVPAVLILVLALCFVYAVHKQANPCISGNLGVISVNLETEACKVSTKREESAQAP